MEEQCILEEEERTPPTWYEVFAFRILNGVMVLFYFPLCCLFSQILSRCHESNLKGDVLPGGHCEASGGRQCLPLDSNFPRPCLSLHHCCGRFVFCPCICICICACSCLCLLYLYLYLSGAATTLRMHLVEKLGGFFISLFSICISIISLSLVQHLYHYHLTISGSAFVSLSSLYL